MSTTTDKANYWHTYFDAETIARAESMRTTYQVPSTGVKLHVDAYEQASPDAPTIIFNHGGGGYSRLFVPLALSLYAQGYTVYLPDQYGQGLSEGSWRELDIGRFVQNLVDVAQWVRQRQTGMLFLAGGSLGGSLTYYAGAAGAPVDGLICHNLYEFGRAEDALAVSRFAWTTAVPYAQSLIASITKLSGRLLPNLPIPYRLLGHFDKMVDARSPDFYAQWSADPVPLKWITLGYMRSLFVTPADVPYERNSLPILVINPTKDEMVDPAVTQRNYERLSGPKHYVELPYGHWAVSPDFVAAWVQEVDKWCRAQ